MVILEGYKIDKCYGDIEVLKNINFKIRKNDRIGLVGNNGAGKTTLANIIFGKVKPNNGVIKRVNNKLRISYLLQSERYSNNRFQEIFTDKDDFKINSFIEIASSMGLINLTKWRNERINSLSGGEVNKLALASVWVEQPDLLILDEPTNHLDSFGIMWLINSLKEYKGAFIVISHNRHFLDQTAKKIYEIEDGKLNVFNGNYSYYQSEKKRLNQLAMDKYNLHQKKMSSIKNKINQLSTYADKSHNQARETARKNGVLFGGKEFYRAKAKKLSSRVKSQTKRLEKLIEAGPERVREDQKIQFTIEANRNHGKRVIEANDLGKRYDRVTLFKSSSFYITHGEKVGVVGPNGCGKTTLIKILLEKDSSYMGDLWISKSAKVGYLSQDVSDLPKSMNSLDFLNITSRSKIEEAYSLLSNMGFTDNMLSQPIDELSYGEKTRLKLVDLIIKEKNVLLLDEPSNHLDLNSRLQLEKALEEFSGTILLVSHDKYILDNVCDCLLVFEDEKIIRRNLSFTSYLKRKNQSSKDSSKRDKLLILENKIANVIGKLSILSKEDEGYYELDSLYQDLIEKKNKIKNN